jgi:tetratricopeptide (TPR) repeat protein
MRGYPRFGRSIWTPVLAVALATGAARPVLAAPSKPSAGDVQRAEELYDNGRKLYGEGSYAAAATAFEQAYELSGNIDMLYNAALAYDRADAFEQAISALDRYRALAPAGERDKLDERKRSLQVRLEKQRESSAPTTDDSTPAGDDDGTDAPYPTGNDRDRPRVFGPAAWGLTGAAIGAFAIGTGFGAASLVRTRKGLAHCTDGDAPLCDDRAKDDADRSREYAVVADVAFAVGGALTIALVTVVAVAASRRKRGSATTSARLEPAASGVLVRF